MNPGVSSDSLVRPGIEPATPVLCLASGLSTTQCRLLKGGDGMANSVNPNQIWVHTVCFGTPLWLVFANTVVRIRVVLFHVGSAGLQIRVRN